MGDRSSDWGYSHIEAEHAPSVGASKGNSEFDEDNWGFGRLEELALLAHGQNPGGWVASRENCVLDADLSTENVGIVGYSSKNKLIHNEVYGLRVIAVSDSPSKIYQGALSRDIITMIPLKVGP
jgi:hypothetical protein